MASPRHPQTLGLAAAIFRGLDDARRRIGLSAGHYNFQRPHQGEGLVSTDRYFSAAPQLENLASSWRPTRSTLAQNGEPRKPL